MVFIDTHILFYAVDTADRAKHERAIAVLREVQAHAVISSQVVCELAVNLGKKLGLSPIEIREVLASLGSVAFVGLTLEIVDQAVAFQESHALSFWDSCIVAAAHSAGCTVLLTEDLQHGQVIDGLTVVNPLL